MVKRCVWLVCAAVVFVASAQAVGNTVASSTMYFRGSLSSPSPGVYTGTIGAAEGYYYVPGGPGTTWDPAENRWETPDGRAAVGGFDLYARQGGTAYVQGLGSWVIGSDHDAYSQGGPWGTWYDPDVPDWQNYHLELTATTWRVWGFLDRGDPYNETALSGPMNWGAGLATETGADWHPTWTWGEERIPLQNGQFRVEVESLGGGEYQVSLTPVPEPVTILSVFVGLSLVGQYLRRRAAGA